MRSRPRCRFAPALVCSGVTFVGAVHTESIDAADCLFVDGVDAVQQQEGCIRHCYLGPNVPTPPPLPPHYRCGPYPAPIFASTGSRPPATTPSTPTVSSHCSPLPATAARSGPTTTLRRGARIERLRRRVHEFVPLGLRAGLTLAPWEE